jgi:hypothetical protein
MNFCPLLRANQAAALEPCNSRFSLRNRTSRSNRLCRAPQRRSVSDASVKPSKLLGAVRRLGAVLIIFVLAASARGQSSVNLAWDASPGGSIGGYRLYDGAASRTYTNVIDVGNVTTQAVTNLAIGVTYFFAITAYDTNGLESDYSSEVSYTVPPSTNNPPIISLTSPANGAAFTAPAAINLAADVAANGHTISQVQFYNGATLLSTAAAAPYSFSWNNVGVGTYSLSAKAVYDSGSTVGSAAANVTVVAGRPPSGLTFAADSGDISAPFVATNGTVFQDVQTDVTNGGLAVYSFDIVNGGDYLVSAQVNAPSEGENSLCVNIDAEPTDPLMIWDIPMTTGFVSRTVSWRGNGTADPATAQYSPKVFTLAAGSHQLIIRGMAANTALATISLQATPPTLRINTAATDSVVLGVTGQPGQTYNVMCSQDFASWTLIGTVTLDASGCCQFTDPACSSRPNRVYCLQAQ